MRGCTSVYQASTGRALIQSHKIPMLRRPSLYLDGSKPDPNRCEAISSLCVSHLLWICMQFAKEILKSVSLRDYSGLGSLKAEPETGLGCWWFIWKVILRYTGRGWRQRRRGSQYEEHGQAHCHSGQLKAHPSGEFWDPPMRRGSWGIYMPAWVVFAWRLLLAGDSFRSPALRRMQGWGESSGHQGKPLGNMQMMATRSWVSTGMVRVQGSEWIYQQQTLSSTIKGLLGWRVVV